MDLLSDRRVRAGLLLGIGAVLAVGLYAARGKGPSAPGADPRGWLVGSVALERIDASDPTLLATMVVRGGEGDYERRAYRDPEVVATLAKFRRIRLDLFRDSAALAPYGLAPDSPAALLLLTPDRKLVTMRLGRLDPADIARVLASALDAPVARAALPTAPGPNVPLSRVVRAAEVALDLEENETALAISRAALAAGASGREAVRARYAEAYALGNLGRWNEANEKAVSLVAEIGADPLAPAAGWVEIASMMRRTPPATQAEISARIDALLERYPASPYAREACLSYALRFLAGSGRPTGAAEAATYLRRIGERQAPYAPDARFTLAFLLREEARRTRNPAPLGEAVEIYRTLAKGEGRIADEALETLVDLARHPDFRADLAGPVTLFLQEIAESSTGVRAAKIRYHLGALQWASGALVLAAKNLEAASREGEFAGRALLLLGTVRLDGKSDPAGAIEAYEGAIQAGLEPNEQGAAAFGRARALFYAKRWADAEKSLAEVLSVPTLPGPFRGEAENLAGRIRDTKETGHKDLERLVDATLLRAKGEKAESRRILEALLAEAPASPVAPAALFDLAKLLDAMGERPASYAALTRLRDHYPRSPEGGMAARILASSRPGPAPGGPR